MTKPTFEELLKDHQRTCAELNAARIENQILRQHITPAGAKAIGISGATYQPLYHQITQDE